MKPKQTFRGVVLRGDAAQRAKAAGSPAAGSPAAGSRAAGRPANSGYGGRSSSPGGARPTGSTAAPSRAVPGGPPRVRVGREVAGRSGKGVSVVTGLPLAAAELEELATRLKKLCGAGGAVKDGVIEIQGDHRDRLVAELQKLGYDAKRSGG